jgi:hypothetical protein
VKNVSLTKFFTTTNVRMHAPLELSKLLKINAKTVQVVAKLAMIFLPVLNVTLTNSSKTVLVLMTVEINSE